MKLDVTYTTERYTAEVDAKAYIRDYRRADYFIEMCRKCKNYGSRYGCPPFDNDPLEDIKDYSKAKIIGEKILPADSYLPLSAANELMEPVEWEGIWLCWLMPILWRTTMCKDKGRAMQASR